MNTASEKFQWATNILVLVFLVVNFVYLFKLTTELKDLNAQVATLKQSVEEFKNIALDLGRRAVDKLDKPASELVTRAKEKLRGFNLEEFLKSQNIEVRIKKQEDAPPSNAPPRSPRCGRRQAEGSVRKTEERQRPWNAGNSGVAVLQ